MLIGFSGPLNLTLIGLGELKVFRDQALIGCLQIKLAADWVDRYPAARLGIMVETHGQIVFPLLSLFIENVNESVEGGERQHNKIKTLRWINSLLRE